MAGTDSQIAAEMMGHATIQMKGRYNLLPAEPKQGAVDRIGSPAAALQVYSTDAKTSTN